MFLEEAIWVGKMLDSIGPAKNRKVANIGSSTGHFRKIVQPHIHISIFDPLEKRDCLYQIQSPKYKDYLIPKYKLYLL